MGQRYRYAYDENGDVLDPASWIEDNNELASEFNGYLDRDNFGRADIAQAEIVANAFTSVQEFSSLANYTPDRTAISWQGGSATGATGLFYQAITCAVDCLLVCETNLTWTWNNGGVWSWPGGVSGPLGPGTPTPQSTFATDCIQFRITVDGVEVGRTGLFDDTHQRYGTYFLGATVVTAGVHAVRVECAVNHRRWEGLGQDGDCTYTVTINNRNLVVTQEKR